MWKILRDRAQGTSHIELDLPCQDAELAVCRTAGGEEILFASCADGAGSASHSQIGAELANNELWRIIDKEFTNGLTLNDITSEHIQEWFHAVRESLEKEASSREVAFKSLACTLLGGIVGESRSVFFQLGDGGIVVYKDEQYTPVFWPQSGEYVNETNFITEDDVDLKIEILIVEEKIDRVAVFTDGIQPLVLDYGKKLGHKPFFDKMFNTLISSETDLSAFFNQYLNSAVVNERTNDDKSLIIAARV